ADDGDLRGGRDRRRERRGRREGADPDAVPGAVEHLGDEGRDGGAVEVEVPDVERAQPGLGDAAGDGWRVRRGGHRPPACAVRVVPSTVAGQAASHPWPSGTTVPLVAGTPSP